MEAIPRLMTSHQVNLCEAIITLCLDELRRIFRQQKSKRVCWYVVANKSKFLPNSLFFCTHHSLRLRAHRKFKSAPQGKVCHRLQLAVFDYYRRCRVIAHALATLP